MSFDRRDFLRMSGATAFAANFPGITRAIAQETMGAEGRADYTIHIATGLVELAPDRIISTTTYNGQFPGPLIRLKEGQRVIVDIHNGYRLTGTAALARSDRSGRCRWSQRGGHALHPGAWDAPHRIDAEANGLPFLSFARCSNGRLQQRDL